MAHVRIAQDENDWTAVWIDGQKVEDILRDGFKIEPNPAPDQFNFIVSFAILADTLDADLPDAVIARPDRAPSPARQPLIADDLRRFEDRLVARLERLMRRDRSRGVADALNAGIDRRGSR